MLAIIALGLQWRSFQAESLTAKEVGHFETPGYGSSTPFGGPVSSLAFSRDEKLLYVAKADDELQVWDWRAAKVLRNLFFGRQLDDCLLSVDEKRLLITFHDRSWALARTSDGEILAENRNSRAYAFAPDGSVLASRYSRSGKIEELLLIRRGEERRLLVRPSPSGVVASPDGSLFVVGWDKAFGIFRLDSNGKATKLREIRTTVACYPAAISGDHSTVALTALSSYETVLFSLRTGKRVGKFARPVYALAPDGRAAIVRGSNSHTILYTEFGKPGVIESGIYGGFCFSRSGLLFAMPFGSTVHIFSRRAH